MPAWLKWSLLGLGALVLGGAVGGGRAWRLVRGAYGSLEEWASDLGRQVRDFFQIQIGRLRPFGDARPQDFTADAWNREKLATIHPRFRARFVAFVAAAQRIARAHGRELLVWQTVRPLETQVEYLRSGASRTIASRHLVGLAIDLALRGEEGGYDGPCEEGCSQSRWPAWYEAEVVPAGKRLGLEWGGDWQGFRDTPHFEIPEREWPTAVAVALQSLREDYPG